MSPLSMPLLHSGVLYVKQALGALILGNQRCESTDQSAAESGAEGLVSVSAGDPDPDLPSLTSILNCRMDKRAEFGRPSLAFSHSLQGQKASHRSSCPCSGFPFTIGITHTRCPSQFRMDPKIGPDLVAHG
ncbi:hypothetical protein R1flu_020530 [Riccia fluitans]|uniref:Uncharacterized protein n=1 Tax=Riccia fluitans TaxID=41844 RepID=A0ABD1ZMY0_9MARC